VAAKILTAAAARKWCASNRTGDGVKEDRLRPHFKSRMNINVAKRILALFIAILIGVAPALANSHGPVFGLATPTNAKCGWSLDLGVMGRAGSEDTGTMSRAMLSYAITEDVQVSFSAPAIFHPPGNEQRPRGASYEPLYPMDRSFGHLRPVALIRLKPGKHERDCAIAVLTQGDAALRVLNLALSQPSGLRAPCAERAAARSSGARR
jgi:hypothetical protein